MLFFKKLPQGQEKQARWGVQKRKGNSAELPFQVAGPAGFCNTITVNLITQTRPFVKKSALCVADSTLQVYTEMQVKLRGGGFKLEKSIF